MVRQARAKEGALAPPLEMLFTSTVSRTNKILLLPVQRREKWFSESIKARRKPKWSTTTNGIHVE